MRVSPISYNPNGMPKQKNKSQNVVFGAIRQNLSEFIQTLATRANCPEAKQSAKNIFSLDKQMEHLYLDGCYFDGTVMVNGPSILSENRDVRMIDEAIDANTDTPADALKLIEEKYREVLKFYSETIGLD